jgi:hypothetical protein
MLALASAVSAYTAVEQLVMYYISLAPLTLFYYYYYQYY